MRQEPKLGRSPEGDLQTEIRELRREVRRLNEHRFVKIQNSMPRMLGFMFVRGLALGLGTVIGASVLVSVLAFALAQIDFLPIIGDWATDFAAQIEAEVRSRQSGAEGTSGVVGQDGSISAPGPETDGGGSGGD